MMNLMLKYSAFVCILAAASCNNPSSKTGDNRGKDRDTTASPKEDGRLDVTADNFQKETTDTAVATKLAVVLRDYLKKDLSLLKDSDRFFSFYDIDLNGDQRPEHFIRLEGNYFCGTGGCTFLLLDADLKPINHFTVMEGPVFRSSKVTNGWHDLIVHGRSKDKFVHLEFDKKKEKYPSNPSVVPEIDTAPSGHDFIMWHNQFSLAKPFKF
jgi:hypothetical protein